MALKKFLGFMVIERGIKANPEKIQVLLQMISPHSPREIQSLTSLITALNHFVSRLTDRCLPFFNAFLEAEKFEWTSECEEAFQIQARGS